VYYHTLAAKHVGATDAQIKEAIAAAALVRKWSTVLNGTNYDMAKFKKEVDSVFATGNN
jgi:alkylhydroperoxidase/carboxymuconolactone decarboxylase family protein YurZ